MKHHTDREIVRLAFPALGALAIEPLVSLIDTAFVGRLGREPLGALGVASAVFLLAFALFNFLAYGTTPLVAAALGRGEEDRASGTVYAALQLAVILGIATALVLVAAAGPLVRIAGAGPALVPGAIAYLRIRSLSLPAVLVVVVGNGAFRGHHDMRTPLVVTAIVAGANLVLDPLFIFTAGWGLAGAAWATVLAQFIGAALFLGLLRGSRNRAPLLGRSAGPAGRRPLLYAGRHLVVRTAALVGFFTLATATAARIGDAAVAAHQVAMQVWLFLSLVIDALAIAAQAMIGRSLGRDGPVAAGRIASRLLRFGAVAGMALAGVVAAAAPVLPGLFTTDDAVAGMIRTVLPFVALMQPLNGLVFVWDGIVMGAAGFGFLAVATAAASAAGASFLLVVLDLGGDLAGVWWAITIVLVVRAVSLAGWHRFGPLRGRS